jgi:hypothetical protein
MSGNYHDYFKKFESEVTASTVASSFEDLTLKIGYAYSAAWTDVTPGSLVFADGDVNVSTNDILFSNHGFETGLKIQLSTTGVLPSDAGGPLATATDFFVIKVDNDLFQLATTRANAIAGTEIDILSAAGGGSHTALPTASVQGTIKLQAINEDITRLSSGAIDNLTWFDISNSDVDMSTTTSFMWNADGAFYRHVRLHCEVTQGQISLDSDIFIKGI